MPPRTAFAPLAIEARDLACDRGGRRVFSRLSFRVANGGLLAVIGPNGSGKSTMLRVLAGLLRLEDGTLRFEGRREDEPIAHYLGHVDALKAALDVGETLRFWAALYGADGAERTVREAAEQIGLGHALDLPVGVLSAGQRRRAGLARLLLAPRPLWLLDEPTAALDSEGEALLGRLIVEHLAAGGLAVVAAHQDLPVTPSAVLDLKAAA
jgi:heme exporter protein A